MTLTDCKWRYWYKMTSCYKYITTTVWECIKDLWKLFFEAIISKKIKLILFNKKDKSRDSKRKSGIKEKNLDPFRNFVINQSKKMLEDLKKKIKEMDDIPVIIQRKPSRPVKRLDIMKEFCKKEFP